MSPHELHDRRNLAIHAQYPSAPLELLGSIEADVYPRNRQIEVDFAR